jgi:ubiquinone biosynthesis protein
MLRHGLRSLLDRFGIHPIRSLRERLFGPDIKEQMLVLSEAERLRLAFEELGPTFIKFGQILSTRHDLIPEEYIRELSKLQDRVPPFSYQEAREMIEKEHGKSLDEIFISFDPEPIAAASIGQVHHARLLGDEEVAVKVMRPGVEELVETDLSILMSFAKFAEKHIKKSRFYNPVGLMDEFSRVIRQEINYIHEAQNADKFYKNFAGSTAVRIPKVYWKYTTKRVLTLEFLEGIRISDIMLIEAAGLNRKNISVKFSNAYLKMIFEDGFYHADPHPGNILVSPEERIIFLDFGMAGYIDSNLRENLVNLMIAAQKDNIDMLIDSLVEIGLVSDVGSTSMQLRTNLKEFTSKYYTTTTKFIDPTAFLRDLIDVLIKSGGKIQTNIILLSKTLIMRDEISRKLDPEHNFSELVEPYVTRMIEERSGIPHLMQEAEKSLLDFGGLIKVFPKKFNHILTKVERGTLKIEIGLQDLEEAIQMVDIVSNRLAISVIIAALLVGSSLIILSGLPGLFGVPFLGIIGFLLAGIMGVGLVISIIRTGKW